MCYLSYFCNFFILDESIIPFVTKAYNRQAAITFIFVQMHIVFELNFRQ